MGGGTFNWSFGPASSRSNLGPGGTHPEDPSLADRFGVGSLPQITRKSPAVGHSARLSLSLRSSSPQYIVSSLPAYIASSPFARSSAIALCTVFCHSILPRHRTELSQYIASSQFAKSHFARSSATAHGTELYLSIYLSILPRTTFSMYLCT